MGYANEVGESFRFIYPRGVMPSYGVAIAYCLGDVQDKGRIAYGVAGNKMTKNVMITGLDALVW